MLSECISIQLPPKSKVRQLATTKDGTVLVLYQKHSEGLHTNGYIDSKSIHCFDKQGTFFHNIQFKETVYSFNLIHQMVIVAQIQKKILAVVNLQTNEILSFPYKFIKETQSPQLLTYSQTDLLCIVQNEPVKQKMKRLNQGNLLLTYSRLGEGQLKQLAQVRVPLYDEEGLRVIGERVSKGNHHSMVVLYKQQQSQVVLLDLIIQGNGEVSTRMRRVRLQSDGKMGNSYSCWEMTENLLVFVPRKRVVYQLIKMFDLRNGQERSLGCELLPIHKEEVEEVYLTPVFLSDLICLSEEQFSPTLQQMVPKRMLFIDRYTWNVQIDYEETTIASRTIEICDFDDSMMTRTVADKESGLVRVQVIRPQPLKNIYMQFLLHLNQDFDDDLLLDALDVIDCL